MNPFLNAPLHFCVLIPCYNDEPGLIRSLKSIRYEAENCAVVIVDDGSSVPVSIDFVKASVPGLRHIHLLRQQQNSGITAALNTGLRWIMEHTTAPYIARLDCRDTCAGDRFYQQVRFLNAHARVGLLGSWCTFKEAESSIGYTYTTPLEHHAIIKAMHLRNVFIHPAVMFRTALLEKTGLYPGDVPHAEDYAFFWKFLRVSEGAILNETLTHCAIVRQGISFSNRQAQLRSRIKVVRRFGDSLLLKAAGIIKLYILLIMPNALLLRLKTLKAEMQRSFSAV